MRLQFWFFLLLLVQSVADEHDRSFDTTVEFKAFVNWSGKKVVKSLKVDAHILLDGNTEKLYLDNFCVLDETDNHWNDGVFTKEAKEMLSYHTGFKILKNGKIWLTNTKNGEKDWSKALKRSILGLFSFEVDKAGNGQTQVTLTADDQKSDFTNSKFSIQSFQLSTNTAPSGSGRCTRTRTATVKYADLSCSNVGDTTIFTVKQFDTAKDKLKKKKEIPQKEYDTNSELKCRPYLKNFAKNYDSITRPRNEFGKLAFEIIVQTYDKFRHQGSVYYTYFLMRESVIKAAGNDLTIEIFLRSIFYIGKGADMRFFQHLKVAFEKKDFGNGVFPKVDSDSDSDNSIDSTKRAKRALDEEDQDQEDQDEEDQDEEDQNEEDQNEEDQNEEDQNEEDQNEEDQNEEEEEELADNEDLVAVSENINVTPQEKEAKLNVILDEWRHGFGIILYKVTDNILSAEAFTIEAILIDGYGNNKHAGSLTNIVRGHYGKHNKVFKDWFNNDLEDVAGVKQVEKVATYLYERAFEAFKNQRHRPIYPHDVKHIKI